jgi:hypothetical protein
MNRIPPPKAPKPEGVATEASDSIATLVLRSCGYGFLASMIAGLVWGVCLYWNSGFNIIVVIVMLPCGFAIGFASLSGFEERTLTAAIIMFIPVLLLTVFCVGWGLFIAEVLSVSNSESVNWLAGSRLIAPHIVEEVQVILSQSIVVYLIFIGAISGLGLTVENFANSRY